MSRLDTMIRFLMIFGPVFALILAGAWMSLGSGVASLGIGRGLRQVASNASHAAALLVVCLVALVLLQQAVGFHMALAW